VVLNTMADEEIRRAELAITEISSQLSEALKPVILQMLNEGLDKHGPAINLLLGIVAFAATEVGTGIDSMSKFGHDRDKLIEICALHFKNWLRDYFDSNSQVTLN
jgi:hypothetical protein